MSIPINTQPSRDRLFEIDSAKGLAIILVVFGHIVMREPPIGNDWYMTLKVMIYSFHMPLFMYLSGIVMFHTGYAYVQPRAFKDFIKKRATRLLIPFFGLGFIIYFGKSIASQIMYVDNHSLGVWEGINALLWDTAQSPANSVWFILAIFIYCLILPPILWVLKNRLWPLLIVATLLFFIPIPEYFYMDKIGRYFIFFLLGGLAYLSYEKYLNFLDKWRWPLIITFLLSLLLAFTDINWVVRIWICGCLSLLAVHSFIRYKDLSHNKFLLFMGTYAFVIYLLNTISIGVTKGVMLHIMPWDGPNFFIFVPLLFLAGVIGPILAKIIIFRHIKFLDKLTN
jgi:fucose 4-O-acetylase-like acetyltransferase